ncbi:MAG: hypothetical protein L6R42_005194, partial [Xanthoria sp. 1 TBL-2021]
ANPANAFLQITQDQPVKPLKSSELQTFDRVLAVKDIRTKKVQLLHSAPRQTVEETVINKNHWWPPVPDEAQPAKVVGSKFAQVKLLELVAAENPGIYVASVHPGFVETAMFRKSGYQANAYPMDTVQLPAHFLVWMASHEAEFLGGRTVWSNWDVEELKARAEEIRKGPLMTAGIYGWPYTPA